MLMLMKCSVSNRIVSLEVKTPKDNKNSCTDIALLIVISIYILVYILVINGETKVLKSHDVLLNYYLIF